jgi:ubiquinone/menaquinone biosynthesis C-methylase UbiE
MSAHHSAIGSCTRRIACKNLMLGLPAAINFFQGSKMQIPPTFHSKTMPILLGSPLKVPSYAWTNWGAQWRTNKEYTELIALSEKGYRDEWDLTTAQGHEDIARAATRAGLGDANQRLNHEAAGIVAREAIGITGEFRILDVGAGSGNTSLAIVDALKNPARAFFHLLDPAREALATAADRLRQKGLVEGKNFAIHGTTDTNALGVLQEHSFQLVVAVAALHHHADLISPIGVLARLLAPGGLLVIADWHNTVWEHPARVLHVLQLLDWADKIKEIQKFIHLYPKAKEPAEETSTEMRSANALISTFWKEYAACRTTTEPQFCILEGHRPPAKYLEAMQESGLITSSETIQAADSNPVLLTPERGLLAVTVGRQP